MLEEIFKNSVEYIKVFVPPLLALAIIAAIIWAIAMLISLIMLGLEELCDKIQEDRSEEE